MLYSGRERKINNDEIIEMKALFQNFVFNVSQTYHNLQKMIKQNKIDIDVLDRVKLTQGFSQEIQCVIKNFEIANSSVKLVGGKDPSEGNLFVNGSVA